MILKNKLLFQESSLYCDNFLCSSAQGAMGRKNFQVKGYVSRHWYLGILAVIIGFALVVRLMGSRWGFPDVYYPVEASNDSMQISLIHALDRIV